MCVAVHFAQNMFLIKKLLKFWAKNKKELDDQEITQIEEDLEALQNYHGGGFLTQEDKVRLHILEANRNNILK